MPTPAEARAELARRELSRRAAARVAAEGGDLTAQGMAAAQAYRAAHGKPPRPSTPDRSSGQNLGELVRGRPARGQARPAIQEANQGLATLSAGIPFMDEAQAGIGALANLATGNASDLPEAWRQARTWQEEARGDFATRRPNAAAFTQSTGAAGSALVPVTRLAGAPAVAAVPQASRLGNAARGATVAAGQGAIYGLADRGTIQERLKGGIESAAISAALGGILGGVLPAAPKPAKPPRARPGPPSDRRVLSEAGVRMTPGQFAGGPIKFAEDIGARTPILGGAIRGARARAGESFNRAAVNRALAPLGETLPPTVRTGPDAIAYASRRLGQAFDDAYALAPRVELDDPFRAGVARASSRMGELTPANRTALEGIIKQRLERLRGPVDGRTAGRIRTEIAAEATRYLKSGDPNQQSLGSILRDVGDELDALIVRSDPSGQAGPMLTRAREGWGSFAVVRRAGANANTGTFTPGQLAGAVRAQDTSVAKGAVARGEARMQDLSGAAARTMPDSFGNPGTSDVGGWLALTGVTATNPAAGAAAVGGLSAASIPWMMTARDIAKQVPRNASPAQVRSAIGQLDDLVAQRPELAQAIGKLRDQLARQVGAGTATRDRPGPPRRPAS